MFMCTSELVPSRVKLPEQIRCQRLDLASVHGAVQARENSASEAANVLTTTGLLYEVGQTLSQTSHLVNAIFWGCVAKNILRREEIFGERCYAATPNRLS